jgi:hypothetical protein
VPGQLLDDKPRNVSAWNALSGGIEVGAVVRRDVETRWGLLYKGLDMYYIPIQLRGYITIGWSTGPNRGCLPQAACNSFEALNVGDMFLSQ